MLTNGTNGNGAPKRWSPAPYAPPAAHYQAVRPQLGDSSSGPGAAEMLMRAPQIAFATSLAAGAASAWLAYGLGRVRNTCVVRAAEKGVSPETHCPGTGWSTFWWIMATAMGVKALHDLSRMSSGS